MTNIDLQKLPKLIESAKKNLSTEDFSQLVYSRCTKYPDEVVPTPEGKHLDEKLERLINTNDFLPASFLNEGAKKANAIGRISTKTSLGTGFLIAPNIIMTNNHVLKSKDVARESFIEFNFETGVDGMPLTSESFSLDPDSIFITHPGLDFTVVRTIGNPGEKYGWTPLLRDPYTITRHERVYIIQHPEGRRKEIGIHDNKVTRILQHELRYTTDTQPGSSGSPCFNKDWELVGLHHSAGSRDDAGKYLDNESIKISSIVKYLEGLHESKSNEAYDVLKYAEGDDPYLGFFGKWGVKLPKENKWESVVTDYRGTAQFLDVGFWNIKHFNDSSPTHRKLRITDAISRLNLDILGLVEISEKPIKFVVKELKKLGKNFNYEIGDVRGAQDLAIIYNESTLDVKVEDWDDEAKSSFDKQVMGKTIFYRHPMKVHVKSKIGLDDSAFDFKLIVLHAKATTHYDHPDVPPAVRKASAKALADAIQREIQNSTDAGEPELDYVIGGDFNAKLAEGSFDVLVDKLNMMALTEEDVSSGNPDAYTYLMRGFKSVIDHIYISKSASIHYDPGSISITRIDKEMPRFTSGISDHAPVAMRLTWDKQRTEIIPEKPTKSAEVTVSADVDSINIQLKK